MDRRVTVVEYLDAFLMWASVANLPSKELNLLGEGIAYVRDTFKDDTARPIGEYCDVMEDYFNRRVRGNEALQTDMGGLRLRILKSCLLDRLLYIGEPLRKIPCPIHKGKWSGLKGPDKSCPHDCDGECGCLTGWLPSGKPRA